MRELSGWMTERQQFGSNNTNKFSSSSSNNDEYGSGGGGGGDGGDDDDDDYNSSKWNQIKWITKTKKAKCIYEANSDHKTTTTTKKHRQTLIALFSFNLLEYACVFRILCIVYI